MKSVHDVEPTILPTHSSQADNRYDVKTEVGKDFEFESDLKPTTPPTHSSQDDNSDGVNTEVGRSRSYGVEGEHNKLIYIECESDVEPTSPPTQLSQDDSNFEVNTEVRRGDAEPTSPPTQSSQDDDKFEVTTGVRRDSSGETRDGHYSMNVDMHGNTNDECEFINKRTWCMKHNCQVNKTTVTSKKWQWIKSKKCYGNVSSKVSKYLCKSKRTGRVVPNISPTRSNLAYKTQGAINMVGRGSSCDVRQVAGNMSERESKLTDGDVHS